MNTSIQMTAFHLLCYGYATTELIWYNADSDTAGAPNTQIITRPEDIMINPTPTKTTSADLNFIVAEEEGQQNRPLS